MRTILAVAFLALACGADADPPRDYTYAGACPAPVSPTMFNRVVPTVCDRGVGYSPRFVTIETCAAEGGVSIPAVVSTVNAEPSHPARLRCFQGMPQVDLFTYDDVRFRLHIN